MSHTGPPSMPSFGFLPSVAPSLSHGTHFAPQGSGWPADASQGQHHHGYYNGALNDYNGAINDQDANTYLGDPMSQFQHDRYCNGALPLQDTSIGLSLAIDQQGPLPHGSTLRNQVLQPGDYQLYPQHFNYFGGNAPSSGQPPAQHVPSPASAPAPGFTQYPPPSRPEPVPCSQPPAPLQVANPQATMQALPLPGWDQLNTHSESVSNAAKLVKRLVLILSNHIGFKWPLGGRPSSNYKSTSTFRGWLSC